MGEGDGDGSGVGEGEACGCACSPSFCARARDSSPTRGPQTGSPAGVGAVSEGATSAGSKQSAVSNRQNVRQTVSLRASTAVIRAALPAGSSRLGNLVYKVNRLESLAIRRPLVTTRGSALAGC